MQDSTWVKIPCSTEVKRELEKRKRSLSNRLGKRATFDTLMRNLLGWQVY